MILVEDRDWLACFGVEYLEAALAERGRRVLMASPGEAADDLVREMIEVLPSMCARRCGCRGARNRALRAVTAAEKAGVDAAAV